MLYGFRDQLARNRSALLSLYVPALFLVAAIWYVGTHTTVTVKAPGLQERLAIAHLVRDPVQSLGAPFYVGIVSNLGALFWCSGAAICFFASALLRRTEGHSEWSRFFGFAGILTTILLVDDFFLLHDEIVPRYLFSKKSGFHINEKVVVGIYGLVALRFLWTCRDTIRRTDWLLFFTAGALLASSVVSERSFTKAFIPTKELRTLTEDGLKLMGIMGWCHYFVRTALAVLSSRTSNVSQGELVESRIEEQEMAGSLS